MPEDNVQKIEECLVSELDPEKKCDILLTITNEITDQIHHLENTANRVTLTVCSGTLIVPIWLLEKIKTLPYQGALGISIAVGLIGLSTIWLLHKNRKHIQWLRRATIRIQQFLGLYIPGAYSNINSETHDLWVEEPIVFPLESQRWGKDGWLETHLPYILAISISCFSSITILLISHV
jgi:hypothetical protein